MSRLNIIIMRIVKKDKDTFVEFEDFEELKSVSNDAINTLEERKD
ncbi:hypothetical protein YN1HA_24850 [Sulfurisphaera ohwakuensis]